MSKLRSYIKSRWGLLASLVFLVIVVLVSLGINTRFDLTTNSIYTLGEQNNKVIHGIEEEVFATILVGDNLPPSFEKLKSETEFLLSKFVQENPNIKYETYDPGSGTSSQINAIRKLFAEKNVFPTNLRQRDESEVKEQLIYPYVHFQTVDGELFVNILENRIGQETEQDAIYRSVIKLEGKFAKALYSLSSDYPQKVGLLALGDLIDRSTFEFVSELSKQYTVDVLSPDMLFAQRDTVAVCIVPVRQEEISLNHLFLLDQYLMNGGKIIWMVEEYDLSIDSIGKYRQYLPRRNEQRISDFMFNHGAKIKGAWVGDLKCSRIPQVIGEVGGNPQTELFNYPFHAVMNGNESHPITKNLKEINLYFPTLIDTVRTQARIIKTPLISSSEYSRTVEYPNQFSFGFLRQPLDVDMYTQQGLTTAILLEGQFDSYFQNRVSTEAEKSISKYGMSTRPKAIKSSKQILITDMEIAMPSMVGPNRFLPPGYNKWERLLFEDNFQFVANSIEYMLHGDRFLDEKSEELTFASLDKKMIQTDGVFWKIFNLIVPPIILFIVFGFYSFYLKKKYGTP